jgi:hypothetical protein
LAAAVEREVYKSYFFSFVFDVHIVVAEVLAAAAAAVLVAHHLPKLGAHLVTARPFEEVAWRQEAREKKRAEGAGRRRYRCR